MSPIWVSNKIVDGLIDSLNIPKELKWHESVKKYIRDKAIHIISMTPEEIEEFENKIKQAALWWNIEHGLEEESKRDKTKRMLNVCIKKRSTFKMLQPWYFDEETVNNRSLLRSIIAIWANKQDFNWVEIPGPKKERSYKNYEYNYKSWLWEKLLMTWEDIKRASIEWMDSRMKNLLTYAINHVNRYFSFEWMIIWGKLEKSFKSTYFDEIHTLWDEQKTAHELIRKYIYFYRLKRKLQRNPEKNALAIDNLTMAQFEIQRLFALASMYNDSSKTHEFENYLQDRDFITNKLWEILERSSNEDSSGDQELQREEWKYPNTSKTTYFISKTQEWNYNVCKDKTEDDCDFTVDFNSWTLAWKENHYQVNSSRVPLIHLAARSKKSAEASVDKILIKWLSSFTEILDQKWIIIVIDSFDNAGKIERILTNELWARETSWIEPMEFPWNINHQTSSSYVVKKWILKVSYKAKDIKREIQDLKEHIEFLETQIKEGWVADEQKEILTKLIKDITQLIAYLRMRARRWAYNIEMEVQIFDLNNYIKAEVDSGSPSYHWTYKYFQRTLDVFPKLFPYEIYWKDALKEFLAPIVRKRLQN